MTGVVQAGEPELRAAAAEVSTLDGKVVSVADFGSSEGANSVSQLCAAVNAIRSTKVCFLASCYLSSPSLRV